MKNRIKHYLAAAAVFVCGLMALYVVTDIQKAGTIYRAEAGEKRETVNSEVKAESIYLVSNQEEPTEAKEPEETGSGKEGGKENAAPVVQEIMTGVPDKDTVQELQPEPEKTEELKPEKALETPAAGNEDPATPPVREEAIEAPAPEEEVLDRAKNGETKGNLIYIEGFGWIENKGGGGSGTVAEDMYENGNKVGDM